MTITKSRMTETEFMRLPDNGRKYELVDGEAKEVPGSVRNAEVAAIVIYRLTPAAIGRGIVCSSQAGFRMASGNLRAPDVSFTRRERLLGGVAPGTFGDAAPDLCIEVVSASLEPADIARKRGEYFASGAQQVWYLYPDMQAVTVYTTPTQSVQYAPQDELDGGALLPAFHCRVSALFRLE